MQNSSSIIKNAKVDSTGLYRKLGRGDLGTREEVVQHEGISSLKCLTLEFDIFIHFLKEFCASIEEQQTKMTKLKDKYKEHIKKKVHDEQTSSVMMLLIRGVSWMNKQHAKLVEKLQTAIETDLLEEEKKFKTQSTSLLSSLTTVSR